MPAQETDIILTLTPRIVRVLNLSAEDLQPFKMGRDGSAPLAEIAPPIPLPLPTPPPKPPGGDAAAPQFPAAPAGPATPVQPPAPIKPPPPKG